MVILIDIHKDKIIILRQNITDLATLDEIHFISKIKCLEDILPLIYFELVEQRANSWHQTRVVIQGEEVEALDEVMVDVVVDG